MIQLPILTEQDLAFLKNKKVFICSFTYNPFLIYQVFRHFNIEVIGYSCLKEEHIPSRWKIIADRIRGLRYIKPNKLASFFEKEDRASLFVQPICWRKEDFEAIEQRLVEWNLQSTHLKSSEITTSFLHVVVLANLKSPLKYAYNYTRKAWKVATSKLSLRRGAKGPHIIAEPKPNTIVICSPPKTADHTLSYTFDHIRKNQNMIDGKQQELHYVNLWHDPSKVDRARAEKLYHPLKIMMGVREPISQNLSWIYQRLGGNILIRDLFYQELFETIPAPSRKELIAKYERLFKNGVDVQNYWDIVVTLYLNSKSSKVSTPRWIQGFMPSFAEHVLDITDYPFDKEKGYTIIKSGGVEVFIYQLEKLNSLVPELSDWVGVPFDSLVNGNQASDKSIAESYKQAQKEIKITQEYFDKCFDEPYVKHCYSEADIEKFKARWRPHIKK